jgi:hypothetical protein
MMPRWSGSLGFSNCEQERKCCKKNSTQAQATALLKMMPCCCVTGPPLNFVLNTPAPPLLLLERQLTERDMHKWRKATAT